MESKILSIQKLNGNNYFLWKFKIELLLQRDKLWSTISQDPPATLVEEWTVRDQAAKATICLSIEDNLLINIRHCKTSKETWKTLTKLYEQPSLSTQIHLMRTLYSTKYENYSCMKDYLNAILELTGQLKSMGETITDRSTIAVMLCGLPYDYNNVITAIEAKEEESLTLDFVKRKLLEESSRRENPEFLTQTEPMAMPTMKNKYKHHGQITCFECGKTGHTRRECNSEALKNGENRWRYRTNEPMNFASNTKTTPRHSNVVMSSTQNTIPPQSMSDEDYPTQYNHCKCMIEESEDHTALSGVTNDKDKLWILDSGASQHMTPYKNFFEEITYLKIKIPITLANGGVVHAEGKGSGLVNLDNDIRDNDTVRIHDVLYVPSLKFQLLSIKQLCKRGHEVKFNSTGCTVYNNNTIIATAKPNGGTFTLNENLPSKPILSHSCLHKWHERMGHRDNENILKMSRDKMAKNLQITSCHHPSFCKACQIGKMKQRSFKSGSTKPNKPFQKIITDVCGPMSEPSLGGNRYILTMTDSYSRFLSIDVIKNKSQVEQKLMNFLEKGHNNFGYYPTTIQSDGGGEYQSETLKKYLESHGITHQFSIPYISQQNGQAERVNSTLLAMTRCMLKHSNLPKKLWGEAASTSTYIINRTRHSATNITPYELWYNIKPDLSNIRTFGCQAFAFTPKILRNKLDDTSTTGYFIGYGINMKGYRLWNPVTNKIITTAKMTFNEDIFFKPTQTQSCDSQANNEESIIQLYPLDNPLDTDTQNCPRRSSRENKGIPPEKLTY